MATTASDRVKPECSKCRAEWSGVNTAHCAACCRTFGSVIAFDMHRTAPFHTAEGIQMRKSGHCIEPERVGLALSEIREYECYVRPEDDSFRKRILAARVAKAA